MNNIDALTWSDVKSTKFDLAILPWGATEPHNLHLPYTTDNLLSRAVSLDAATKAELRGVRSVVLPAIPLGAQNPGQTELLFCLHARMETQKAILQDIVASLHYQGLRRLLIINGHGGNIFNSFVRDLALDYKDFLIVTSDYFKLVDANAYFDEPGDHAGELETSLMLHYYPELVKPAETYGKGESKQFSIKGLRNRSFWLPVTGRLFPPTRVLVIPLLQVRKKEKHMLRLFLNPLQIFYVILRILTFRTYTNEYLVWYPICIIKTL